MAIYPDDPTITEEAANAEARDEYEAGICKKRADAYATEFNLPKVDDPLALSIMKSILGLVCEGLVFATFITGAVFVIVNLPEAFTGNYYYTNILFVSVVFYFILYGLALLFSCTTHLFYHNSQKEPSPRPKRKPFRKVIRLIHNDETFKDFYSNQIQTQNRILERIEVLQEELNRMFKPTRKHSRSTPPPTQPKRESPDCRCGVRFSETETVQPTKCDRPVPAFKPTAGQTESTPLNQPCPPSSCFREHRPCTDCLRNPDCKCKTTADEEERLRKFGWEQEAQVVRMVERLRLQKRLDDMTVNPR